MVAGGRMCVAYENDRYHANATRNPTVRSRPILLKKSLNTRGGIAASKIVGISSNDSA